MDSLTSTKVFFSSLDGELKCQSLPVNLVQRLEVLGLP